MKHSLISIDFGDKSHTGFQSMMDALEETKKQARVLLERLDAGGKIVRADSTGTVIVYILEKPT